MPSAFEKREQWKLPSRLAGVPRKRPKLVPKPVYQWRRLGALVNAQNVLILQGNDNKALDLLLRIDHERYEKLSMPGALAKERKLLAGKIAWLARNRAKVRYALDKLKKLKTVPGAVDKRGKPLSGTQMAELIKRNLSLALDTQAVKDAAPEKARLALEKQIKPEVATWKKVAAWAVVIGTGGLVLLGGCGGEVPVGVEQQPGGTEQETAEPEQQPGGTEQEAAEPKQQLSDIGLHMLQFGSSSNLTSVTLYEPAGFYDKMSGEPIVGTFTALTAGKERHYEFTLSDGSTAEAELIFFDLDKKLMYYAPSKDFLAADGPKEMHPAFADSITKVYDDGKRVEVNLAKMSKMLTDAEKDKDMILEKSADSLQQGLLKAGLGLSTENLAMLKEKLKTMRGSSLALSDYMIGFGKHVIGGGFGGDVFISTGEAQDWGAPDNVRQIHQAVLSHELTHHFDYYVLSPNRRRGLSEAGTEFTSHLMMAGSGYGGADNPYLSYGNLVPMEVLHLAVLGADDFYMRFANSGTSASDSEKLLTEKMPHYFEIQAFGIAAGLGGKVSLALASTLSEAQVKNATKLVDSLALPDVVKFRIKSYLQSPSISDVPLDTLVEHLSGIEYGPAVGLLKVLNKGGNYGAGSMLARDVTMYLLTKSAQNKDWDEAGIVGSYIARPGMQGGVVDTGIIGIPERKYLIDYGLSEWKNHENAPKSYITDVRYHKMTGKYIVAYDTAADETNTGIEIISSRPMYTYTYKRGKTVTIDADGTISGMTLKLEIEGK